MEALELDNNNANTSILLLRDKTRNMISNLLNPRKLLRTEQGIPRDWQGLAELCGISGELIPSILNDKDPTAKVLKLWHDQSKTDATVGKLISYFDQMDRTDVVDDVSPLIAEDLKYYKEHPPNSKSVAAFDLEADKHILTRDDVMRINEGLEPQRYDAFVLFADDDIDFATELIENMEKNYNLKFCVKERDLVVGGSEHDAVIKLIAERCGRLIVIISPAFLESNANKFFYSLAQSIAIEQRQRKIIPCIYKECGSLPPELSCYFKLDFRRTGAFFNFWDRLYDSIRVPEYKHKMKLSLPENSLFRREDMTSNLQVGNAVYRSDSYPNQLLAPNDLKSAMHKDSDSSQNISHSVKFSSSMSNLPTTEVPQDNMAPSTSANSLGKYQEQGVRKTLSFYKKIKSLGSIFPKSKSKSGKQTSEQELAVKIDGKQNGKIPQNTEVDKNKIKDSKTEDKEIIDMGKSIKEEKKEKKKKIFSLKRNKKKAVLADT